MKELNQILLTVIIISLYTSATEAQSINDEFKMKLRESLTAPPEMPKQLNTKEPKIELQGEKDVLRVSPTTKLPTKFDRMLIMPMMELDIKIEMKVTNAPPINVRPAGSTAFVFDGRQMRIMSTAGQTVTPSGMDFGVSRKKERQYERAKKLSKAYME